MQKMRDNGEGYPGGIATADLQSDGSKKLMLSLVGLIAQALVTRGHLALATKCFVRREAEIGTIEGDDAAVLVQLANKEIHRAG